MNVALAAILLFFGGIAITSAQTGVCTRSEAITTVSSYYVQTSYYYSYSCGFWSLSRCGGTSYGSSIRYRADTTYNLVYECCSGYYDPLGGISCEPYCEDCDSNHICIAPYTCVCPDGWMGDDCMEDINECSEGTSGCEHMCTNNNGSYTCSCDKYYTLGLDLHSCLGPPRDVSLNASSSTTLHLQWDGPELDYWDGNVNSYGINCTSQFGFYHYVEVESGLGTYDINTLMPFSYYMCCVHAMTTNGDSNYTCDIEQTLQDLPDDVPQNITITNHSTHAVFIQWESPLVPNGIIILYTIYADYNNGSGKALYVNATARSYILEGLSPYQLISINMSASTIVGEGPASVNIAERTSQSVPSEVREFELGVLSENTLLVTWNLPEYLNGILTNFKIVVYNHMNNYSISLFVPETITNISISDKIEPFVPYTVEISAFTQAGEGPALTSVAFTKEGELNTYQCLDIDPSTSQSMLVYETMFAIDGLIPGKEYCVEVAAKTLAGVGNYTKLNIPLYRNVLFQVHFYGVHNCPEWVHKDPLVKIDDFVDGISLELSNNCDCHIPIDNFADERLICEQDHSNKVVFQGKIVETKDKNTSELLENLKEWVVTEPHVVIQGVQLEIDQYCSVELIELGESECVSTTLPPPPTTKPTASDTTAEAADNKTDANAENQMSVHVPVSALGGGIAGLLCVVIIIVIVTVLIVMRCTKANKQHMDEPRFNLPDYFSELNTRTIENPMYSGPNVKNTGGLPAYDELEESNNEKY